MPKPLGLGELERADAVPNQFLDGIFADKAGFLSAG